jgi:cyclase
MASRRGFLRTSLGACWTGAALLEQSVFRAAHARALAPGASEQLFNIERVAPGVYAAIARPQVMLNCNAAIFERSADLLVVDTHSKPSAVVALVAQIKAEVSPKPVRYVVNSHFHWDHTQGAPAYRRLAPGAQIVASETTRQLLSELGAERLRESLSQLSKTLDDSRVKLAAATTPAEKQYYSSAVQQLTAYAREMKDYAPELPDVTFDKGLILHDKSQELHLVFCGKAHTAGDVMVWSPSRKVIATGDVLHGFTPFIADGYPRLWPITLLRVAGMPFDHVIGGHAAVQNSREPLYLTAAYIDELADVVGRGKQAGRTVEELQSKYTPATLRSLQGPYRDFLLQAPKYIGEVPGESPEQWLANGVKSNIADVYKTIDKS